MLLVRYFVKQLLKSKLRKRIPFEFRLGNIKTLLNLSFLAVEKVIQRNISGDRKEGCTSVFLSSFFLFF